MKIFDFRFVMDLHGLDYPKFSLTIFGKRLLTSLSVCLRHFLVALSQELQLGI